MRIIATDRQHSLPLRRGWVLPNIFGAGLLFGWIWSISVAYDFGMSDESWFLQVLTRVVNGDVLYRDVFFGATPLSIYLAAPLIAIFGSEIVVVKAFVSVCFVVTVLVCAAILRYLGNSQGRVACLLLALLAYGWPERSAGYTPLAYACLVSCLGAALGWRLRTVAQQSNCNSVEMLALAGGLAGLCFAAKQNLGAYALAALAATALLTLLEVRAGWRRAGWATLVVATSAALVVVITLVPVVLSGGLAQFVDYGFTNKRTYLRTAGIAYRDGLRNLVQDVQVLRSFDDIRWVYLQTMFLLPPLALVTLLLAWIAAQPQQRGNVAPVGLFVGAALLGVYPRADLEHVVYAVPTVLLGAGYAGGMLVGRLPRWTRQILGGTLVFWLVLGIGLLGSGALARALSPNYELSTLPHYRGVLLTKHEHATHHRYLKALQTAAVGEQPFILSPYAGFSYLVADLENPTPFDYPVVTAFGQHGMAEIMEAIEHGRIRSICMTRNRGLPLSAHQLMRFVSDHMHPVAELEFCTLYQTRTQRLDGRSSRARDW